MYCILMDSNTKTYYMEPSKTHFYLFSDPSLVTARPKNARIVETDIEDRREIETQLYNAGFFRGYLDGKEHAIIKTEIYYYDRNPNEIAYAQYLLTKDEKYLELINKRKLYTLCRIDGQTIYFPTVKTPDGETAVLTYTDLKRIPAELSEKYNGWKIVNMTFDVKCVINDLCLTQ